MNIASWLRTNAERLPGKPALLFEDRTYSHAGLYVQVCRFANALEGLGVRPGDRVGLFLGNCPEFLIARWGAIALGATAAPMNVMFQKSEARYVLNNASPRVLVTSADKLDLIEDIWVECPHLEHVVVVGEAPYGTHAFAGLIAAADERFDLHDCAPDDVCDLYYTSGTTGRPKGVMCSHANFTHLLRYESIVWGMREDDRSLVVLPLFHAKGLIIPCLLASYAGATMTLMARWDTEQVLATIQEQRITFFAGVPTMYTYMLAHPRIGSYDLSSLRLCRTGGAPIPIEVHTAFERQAGIKVIEGYGCTGWVGTSHPLSGDRVIGSIGKALGAYHPEIDCEIRIVDGDGNELPPDTDGELVVRGAHIPKGFWRMPGKTRSDYRNGWFHTGDIARKDERGFIYLVGRKDDLIITAGFNVYPREIEELLYNHDAVLEAAVVGVDDDDKGQLIKAFIVPKEGRATVTADQIIEYCRNHIARYKVPRQVEFVPSLPKTASGKVQRRLLAASRPAKQEA